MLYKLMNISSRAATAENINAEAGSGGKANNGRKGSPSIWPFKKGETVKLLSKEGPGVIRHIWMTVPPGNFDHMRNIILRMYWDGQPYPSVEAPIGDFFGIAHGRQRNMVSECICMQDGKGLNCWIPMPFKKSAVITVENVSCSDVGLLFYQIDFTLGDELDDDTGYFHAQFRRKNPCPIHEDYTILDGVKGRGLYLGTVIGVRSLFSDAWWGEGEIKFYIDADEKYPTICGTGLEDYIGSAWGLGEITTNYQGAPLVEKTTGLYSLYRFHVKDPIYFNSLLKVTAQQIGFGLESKAAAYYGGDFVRYQAAGCSKDSDKCYFDRSDDYCSVAYWYQTLPTIPFPALPDYRHRTADLTDKDNGFKLVREDE